MRFLRHNLLWRLSALLGVLFFHSAMLAQESTRTGDPAIKRMVQPMFPRWLLEEGISSGTVRLLVEVDAEGNVQDVLVVEARHVAFVEASLDALNNWKFRPRVVNGKNYGYVKPVKLEFDIGQTVINLTTMGFTNHLTRNTDIKPKYEQNAVRMRDLDSIPKPLSMAAPHYTAELQKLGMNGTVTVEFYIDSTGKVRVPYVTLGTGTQLDELAVETVRGWWFEPPLSNGKPVLVKATQTFAFRTGSASTAGSR